MDNEVFARKLNEIVDEIGSIPRPDKKKLIVLGKKTDKYDKKFEKTVRHLQGTLDYLRISIKYLLFDLEATRRENAYLRKLLQDGDS
jgi:thioredoxin-related protein